MLSCDYCEYKTNQKPSLSRHLNTKHPEFANIFRTCKICNKEFMSSSSCRKHEIKCKTRHEKKEAIFPEILPTIEIPETYISPSSSEIEEIFEEKEVQKSEKLQKNWLKSSMKTFFSVAFMGIAIKFLFQLRRK